MGRSVRPKSADATFTEEARWVAGDRAVMQWRYDWAGDPPRVRARASISSGSVTGWWPRRHSYVKG